jgi:hypothetical protein
MSRCVLDPVALPSLRRATTSRDVWLLGRASRFGVVIMLIMLLHYYGCNIKLKFCKFGTTGL